ncbi:MAG TPA: hypothetical protein VES20_05110 [Bryobacteraceae bacterium]|nr:hypothetical protein [Bryobacteraceae bacterium]
MAETTTPPATEAVAQTREPAGRPSAPAPVRCEGRGASFEIGEGVRRARKLVPYDRKTADPVYRPLRVFTIDPTVPSVDGATAVLNVPWEPVKRGPAGYILEVAGQDGDLEISRVDLDAPHVLINSGLPASSTNHQFHQQMVYAVSSSVYAAFRLALGRHLAWGFDGPLCIYPHVPNTRNAYYSKDRRALFFGYYKAGASSVREIPPDSLVYTCLSHDIIVHELTHALLDGLRSRFMMPTGPDVLGFHEGFADLVAIFQHFTYREVLRNQIGKTRGELHQATLLTGIAHEFGYTNLKKPNVPEPLRSAVDDTLEYEPDLKNPYRIGSTLVAAVFDAFTVLYTRRTERYVRIATGGTGVLPEGALHPDLVEVLADEAAKLAGHILTMCIRALDYCPPVDLRLGEYLRALITADRDLIPDDKRCYRETMIRAFARRRIYPSDVPNLSEDALLWRSPRTPLAPIDKLCFSELKFAGEPSVAADENELMRQACALGEYLTRPDHLRTFGLMPPGDRVDIPVVESIRTSRRVGPAGQIVFDLIAEVTQRRTVKHPQFGWETDFYGGVTVIIDPKGEIRYTVLKRVDHEQRLQQQLEFQANSQQFWNEKAGRLVASPEVFRLLDDRNDE